MGDDGLFLPDFCAAEAVFAMVVAGELLAMILALAEPAGLRLSALALLSLYVQWITLCSAAILCTGRNALRRLGNAGAGLCAWALVLLVTLAVNQALWWLNGTHLPEPSLELGSWLDFQARTLGISAIVSAVTLRYLYVLFQWRRRVESEAQARLQALQARIRPHFLFNSMNTIASLTRSAPQVAEQVVEDLADLFRVSLSESAKGSDLGRELELCRQYVRIEQLRLGERLRVEWALDAPPEDLPLPALLLQPLVENAVYHGIEPAPAGGTVRISVRRAGGRIQCVISNTLAGGTERDGHRMALENVRERLAAFFGARADFEVRHDATSYTVALSLPLGGGGRTGIAAR